MSGLVGWRGAAQTFVNADSARQIGREDNKVPELPETYPLIWGCLAAVRSISLVGQKGIWSNPEGYKQ